MYMIPIVSRQIAYVQYDDQSANMTVHYHTGHTQAIHDVQQADYLMIVASNNRYDCLMKLSGLRETAPKPKAIQA
ncbi:hypothetical protein D3C73_780490 [compost metagenome]